MTEENKVDYSKMNVYQKLNEVRKEVSFIRKDKKGYQFNYAGSSDVLMAVNNIISDVGLILVPSVTDTRLHIDKRMNNKNKEVTEYFTEIDMDMTWVNVDNPEEKVKCSWYTQGTDTDGEKGTGKAYTYGEKYFILKFFNIATDKDDPDSFQKQNGNQSQNKQNNNYSNTKQNVNQNNNQPNKKEPVMLDKSAIETIENLITIKQKSSGKEMKEFWLDVTNKVGFSKKVANLTFDEGAKLMNVLKAF